MSNSYLPTTASSSNSQVIFNNALNAYEKRTKKDLLAHPLAAELQDCDSPAKILAVLYRQVQGLDQSLGSDNRWTKWLDPTVNVLYIFSDKVTLEQPEGIRLVIFVGVGVLLSAAKDIRKSHETLIKIFGRIEKNFRRLEIHTQVPSTPEMIDLMAQIMTEFLTILGIVTEEIKQSRMRKHEKRLIVNSDMEDALRRLETLTQEEARMAIAENLRATHDVDERVTGDTERVLPRVANIRDGSQLSENIHKWLAPPDPSTNHNIACATHHKKTATWFFEGNIYQEWKSKGSLMWIHGKPGSGKSVLCSMVIEDIKALCDVGQASMAYFYFDFRNANKQSFPDLLPSLLTQLSVHSSSRCKILSELYSDHKNGKDQPSDTDLTKCLENVLSLPNQPPIYLIMDALDESPITSGIPLARKRVLQLLKGLVDLGLPKLHICITSRPEIDIRNAIEPLASHRVSLHDETGQKEDIADYVRSIVYSDSDTNMKRWKKEDKDMVVRTLTERADGMFRWTFCQLEVLSNCLPSSVRHFLDELPESLDTTYERMLREIKKPNRAHARRILHCLVVAIRPLRVEELAEVLAIDFNDGEGIPKLKTSWRWKDQEQALLTLCSSLIAVVDTGRSRVVQFSHFSVKAYLTSVRLAKDISRYHITFKTAHAILAQSCVSALLQLDDHDGRDDVENKAPLAAYAAEYWVRHAQFEDVASRIKGMEHLFDVNKPYFEAWRRLHNIDTSPRSRSVLSQFEVEKSDANTPLYFAARCGFSNLVEQLIAKHPQHVDAIGGIYRTPAVAALAGRHFELAQVLHRNQSSVEPRGFVGTTPLHSAAYYGDLEMVQVLLELGVDVNAQNRNRHTPLGYASVNGHGDDPRVARLLIEHGADPNAQNVIGFTPLHSASECGRIDIVRLLIEHGANLEVKDKRGRTPLDVATEKQRDEIVKLLQERLAK